MKKEEAKTEPQFKKGDRVWMGFDESSSGRSGTGHWEWRQVKIVDCDPDAGDDGEYKVQTDPDKKDSETRSVSCKQLEGWQNLKAMLQ